LIVEGTLGYLALLRNLRNIVTVASDEVFTKAMEMLVDEKRVRKSLVFPHQIDLAFEVLMAEGGTIPQVRRTRLLTAVNKAYELSVPNLTDLFTYGRTAVVIDTSGSMTSPVAMGKSRINARAVEKAALIGATLAKGIGADMYHFSNSCSQLTYNPLDSVNIIKNMVVNRSYGGGTEFNSIFRTLSGKYDRVFVISDMQGCDSILKNSSYQSYIKSHGQPYVYSIDLCGYGNTMFKQSDKLIQLYGYSADIYEMVKSAEIDPRAILKEIRKIVI